MKRNLLLAIFSLLSITIAFGQRQITGLVTSSEDGGPLPGVSVIVKGTVIGTTTDANGEYSLEVPQDATILVFSYIGMATIERTIGTSTIVNAVLQPEATGLDEVVVTAFGITRERKALGYSVQEIDGRQIGEAGTPNAINALQGKVAGVMVNQSSGMPGSSSFLRIRGSNSFIANNEPLMVVDGMPIQSTSSGFSTGDVRNVSALDYSSRSVDLNHEDIASVTVLKGPAAAALYGLRASNGVILITTKSGKGLAQPSSKITVTQTISLDQVAKIPEVQQTYAQGAGGMYNPLASLSFGPRVDDLGNTETNPFAIGDGRYVNNVGDTVTPQIYDNISPMFKTGVTSNTNIDIIGRTDGGNYALGFGHTNQEGFIPNSGMTRVNLKLAGEMNLTNRLVSGAVVNFVTTDIDKHQGGSNLSNVLFTTYWAPISYDLWGTPFATETDPWRQIHFRGAMDNPRWALEHNRYNEKVSRMFGSTYLGYEINDWMHLNYRLGIDMFTERRKEFWDLGSGATGGRTTIPSGGRIIDATYYYQQLNSNLNLSITRNLTEDIGVDVLIGNEVIDIQTNFQNMEGNNVQIGGFDNISNTASQVVTQTNTAQRTIGIYGSATFNYKTYLFLTVTGRNDRVSNMPSENRDFFYPSVALGFVFSEALNLEGNTLSFGKIRLSYAEVGQAGPLYATRTPFIQGGAGTGFTVSGIDFPFAGLVGYQQSNILRSPDLVPQNTRAIEVGAELAFMMNRIGLDFTYFVENTTDQIFQVPVATSTGYSSEIRNAGKLETKGMEVMLRGTPIQQGPNGFNWDIMLNYTKFTNNVIELAEGVENIYLGGFVEPNVRAMVGHAYPVIFGSKYLRDDEGNIVYDSRAFLPDGNPNPRFGMPIADPEAGVVGDVTPDWQLGLSSSLRYKNFRLAVHFDYRQGGQMYAGNTRLQKLYGMDIVTEDRETPYVHEGVKGYLTTDASGEQVLVIEGPNDIAVLRGQSYWGTYMDAIVESNVYETTFLKFRELALHYTLPAHLFENNFIKGATVNLFARNIAVWTNYPNFDPESSLGSASDFQGLEYVNLPQIRNFGLTVKLDF